MSTACLCKARLAGQDEVRGSVPNPDATLEDVLNATLNMMGAGCQAGGIRAEKSCGCGDTRKHVMALAKEVSQKLPRRPRDTPSRPCRVGKRR